MRKRHYTDGNPWKEWDCRDEHPHSIRWDDSGEGEERNVCLYCGLNIVKNAEGSFVEGYHLFGGVFPDLETARARGEKQVSEMVEKARPDIADLCADVGVTRLDMFGSTVTGLARPDSDVDVLVTFRDPIQISFKRYLDLKKGLERIFGRDVDLVEERLIKNKYFKQVVERDKRNVYAS